MGVKAKRKKSFFQNDCLSGRAAAAEDPELLTLRVNVYDLWLLRAGVVVDDGLDAADDHPVDDHTVLRVPLLLLGRFACDKENGQQD